MTLDLSGLSIKAVAADGTETDVTQSCTFTPADGSTLPEMTGPVQIRAEYEEGGETFVTAFDVQIKRIVSVGVTQEPTKKSYHVGERIDLTGLVVTASNSDGTSRDVTAQCTTIPADGSFIAVAGQYITVTVYNWLGQTAGQFNIRSRAATVIDSGEGWALYNLYGLVITQVGSMPNYGTSQDAPWYSNRGNIRLISFGDTVTSIGNRNFVGINISELEIPGNITAVGDGAFSSCYFLEKVILRDGVQDIGAYAFAYDVFIEQISIPLSVRFIRQGAFYSSNTWAPDVYYSGTKEQWKQITIGTDNTALTSATIHYNSSGPT